MAAEGKNRMGLLVVLLVALVATVVYMNLDRFMPEGRDDAENAEGVSLGERLNAMRALPEFELDRPLVGADYTGSRNLFSYSQSPAAARKDEEQKRRKEQQAAKARTAQELRRQRNAKLPPPKPQKPRDPPPPDFRYGYIGYFSVLTQPVSYMAVLTKSGQGGKGAEAKKDNMRVVTVGDIVDDAFVVKKIDMDVLVVGYTNPKFREKTKTVKLKLAAANSSKQRGAGKGGKRRRGS